MDDQEARMEQKAIDYHRLRMTEQLQREVSIEEALTDWGANYRMKWRAARMARVLALQRSEIERHRWIESEKAQHDVGRRAAMEWVQHHAADWRREYDEKEEWGVLPEIYE